MLRSCLVVRGPEPLSVEVNGNGSDSLTDWSEASEPTSPLSLDSDGPLSPASRAAKKRVVFADAKGLSLTQIKMMTEPSDCPPRWTAEFLEQVPRNITRTKNPQQQKKILILNEDPVGDPRMDFVVVVVVTVLTDLGLKL